MPAATLLEKRLSEEIETKYKGRLKPSMTIEQAEDAIKTYKVEHGMVWDVDGTPLARLKGAKGSVRFPPHVVNRIKARGRATVFTHNHPNGNPTLSAGDLHAAVFMNQHRTRVITARGGMEMRVIDAAKWEHARQQRVFIEVDFKRAEKAAAQAGRDAVDRQFANVQYFSREVVDQSDAVYVEAMATEALKQYNRIGEKYGFTVTRF